MRRLVCTCALIVSATVHAQNSLNLPAGRVGHGVTVQTRLGSLQNAVLYAPRPVVPPGIGRGIAGRHGVYAIDIGVVSGIPYSVRVLRSTGSFALDDAIMRTLEQWRFQPRSIYKAIVPVDVLSAP